MKTVKYYDWKNSRVLSDNDGCPLDQWLAGTSRAHFGIHPLGFPVFLDPTEIPTSDEYRGGDRYSVSTGLDQCSPFQKRRLECTLQLMQEATSGTHSRLRICDLGCGEGHITAAIAQAHPHADISGLDYSISAITRATGSYPGIDFVVANAYTPPYCHDYFDVVVCNNLWEHVPDPLHLLQVITRILTDNGALIISTPSRYRLINLLRVGIGKQVSFLSDHHITEYSVGQVIEQLRYGGYDTKFVAPAMQRSCTTLCNFAAFRIAMPLLAFLFRVIGSHHSLEETVFYLGKKHSHNGL